MFKEVVLRAYGEKLVGLDYLLNRSGFKVAHRVILYRVAHLDRMAANLAIFHIDLAFHRGVQHHRYLLPATWAREEVLHSAQDKRFAGLDEGVARASGFGLSDPPTMSSLWRSKRSAAPDHSRPTLPMRCAGLLSGVDCRSSTGTWKCCCTFRHTRGYLLSGVRHIVEKEVVKLKTILSFFVLFGLSAVTMFAADQTWTGKISDSMCGATHQSATEHGGKKMSDRDCTLACVKEHQAKYVFVHDGKVLNIANQDAAGLEEHAGHTVNLTGALDGDTITVSKIEMSGHMKKKASTT